MWEFVDYVYVLCLEGETGRHDAMTRHLLSVGFRTSQIVLFIRPGKRYDNDVGNKVISLFDVMFNYPSLVNEVSEKIATDHFFMVEEALNHSETKPFARIMFLEDDARFLPFSKNITRLGNFVRYSSYRWDQILLGYCPLSCSFFLTPNIVRVGNTRLRHASILSVEGMRKIIEFKQKEFGRRPCPFDIVGNRIPHFRKLAVFPMICFQMEEPALYRRIVHNMCYPLPFSEICQCLEICCVLCPLWVLLGTVIGMMMVWKKTIKIE